jgi:hypothetical protein
MAEFTERQWLRCNSTIELLSFLRVYGQCSERKLRLAGCACCRHIWDLLTEPDGRHTVEVVERYADGLATQAEIVDARARAVEAGQRVHAAHNSEWCPALSASIAAAEMTVIADQVCFVLSGIKRACLHAARARTSAPRAERVAQARLVRDIFANPFRPMSAAPRLAASGVVAIARTIYEERHFIDMPVLGDALEEAGCTDRDILAHCRRPGDHVRGCWVVDWLLGKK